MWYEPSQGADKTGDLAGVPYDGKMTKADGKGLWWDGMDPQELYAQNHPPSTATNTSKIWDWPNNGSMVLPDAAYCEKFFRRTMDLIDKYQPDLLYFDDTWCRSTPSATWACASPRIYYNSSIARNGQA